MTKWVCLNQLILAMNITDIDSMILVSLARLDIIQYLKNLGMTLKEIKEIFDSKNLELLQEKLEESKLQINNQIIQLNEQKAAIQKTIDSFELFKAAPKVGMITLEFIK